MNIFYISLSSFIKLLTVVRYTCCCLLKVPDRCPLNVFNIQFRPHVDTVYVYMMLSTVVNMQFRPYVDTVYVILMSR